MRPSSRPETTQTALLGAAIVVGLAAEARLARRLGLPVATGGGTADGARGAAEVLIAQGVIGLISFGLAGGIDPALPSGTLLIPAGIRLAGRDVATDPALTRALGGPTPHVLLAGDTLAAEAAVKSRLHDATGCAAIDLETAAVAEVAARHGLPFAVLRAICDPAGADLPPAARVALDPAGTIGAGRVLVSVLARPGQIRTLVALARHAAAARGALVRHIAGLRWAAPLE